MANSIFSDLYALDVSSSIKTKKTKTSTISYLPWSSAWAYIKQYDPDARYRVERTEEGNIYHTDGKTCWVETSLTIKGVTYNEMLAVMDFANQAVSLENVTMVQVNKAIKRCFVKNAALFGLGLSLWYGEEISDAAQEKIEKEAEEKQRKAAKIQKRQNELIELCKAKIATGADSEALYDIIGKYIDRDDDRNPRHLKDEIALADCINEISEKF